MYLVQKLNKINKINSKAIRLQWGIETKYTYFIGNKISIYLIYFYRTRQYAPSEV